MQTLTDIAQFPEAKKDRRSARLLNKPLLMVIGAQFFSALADNAIFFALLEFLPTKGYSSYSTYLLQGSFVFFYILLAPLVGYFADSRSKGAVLFRGNALKIAGVLLLFLNINPFLCYALVGMGAAIYSPAKFGILSELVKSELLVKANALIEGSTILAILLGAYLGGTITTSLGITVAIIATALFYGAALISNLFIPKLSPMITEKRTIGSLLPEFIHTLKALFASPYARFAILGTSLFWGAATTLRLLLNDWVRDHLGKGIDTVALFNIIVSVGIVIGAFLASFLITIKTLRRALWAGVAMGIITAIFSFQSHLFTIYLLLVLVGIFGGLYVIPLNALLQKSGQDLHGVGQAVAVQNFAENSVTLCMMGIFAFFSYLDLSATLLMIGFGGLFCLSMAALSWEARRQKLF
ncbi:MAG: lysophospholipid transporter LplT [Xanthomonadaceae bacterium]|nr:lysophospholipid transporter LplT [Xanthomonadaceae bacterium]